jgi:hypothetical protein
MRGYGLASVCDVLALNLLAVQTRWYAFQFMMQELSDDLEAMHGSMATVLKMLPNALAARNV